MASIFQVMTLGEKIKEARVRAGLLQEQLAEALTEKGLKCEQSAISAYENDVTKPPIDKLHAIADVCGVDMNYFFDLEPQIAEPPAEYDAPATKRDILEVFEKLRKLLKKK